MTQPAYSQNLEIEPQDYMSRLASRLRVNYNKEMKRYVASFAGVYEKIDSVSKRPVLGIGQDEMDACRILARRMRELYQINKLQVLADPSVNTGPEIIVTGGTSCNTWFKR